LKKEWFSMSMVRKLHPHIVKDLREFVSENNISTKKLVIDLEAETIESPDDIQSMTF
jgi:hypothetical protein